MLRPRNMATEGLIFVAVATVVATFAMTGTSARIFTVGGDKNWIVPNGGLNYTQWAGNLSAHVNDSLYFKYNPNAHTVLRVNSTMYASCNTSNYLATFDTGDTTVSLAEEGTYYFICGAPNHCAMGQAFSIHVGASLAAASPSAVSPSSNPPGDSSTAVHLCWLIASSNSLFLAALSLVFLRI